MSFVTLLNSLSQDTKSQPAFVTSGAVAAFPYGTSIVFNTLPSPS